MQKEENKEEPKSYLHKKGDEDQMQEYEEREKDSRASQITAVAKPVSET